jgi:hypothetical protein
VNSSSGGGGRSARDYLVGNPRQAFRIDVGQDDVGAAPRGF